jgi:GNAT superfamily N-acetyltransferase
VIENVDIRPLSPSDSLDELTELLHRAYAIRAAAGLHFVAATQDVGRTRRRIAKGGCFVAIQGGRIVGTINFLPVTSTNDSPWLAREDVCSFQQFAVEPELQGNGIGRRLIEVCERRARETGAAELALDTAEPAMELIWWYERLGFRFMEHVKWPEVNYRSVILSKRVR